MSESLVTLPCTCADVLIDTPLVCKLIHAKPRTLKRWVARGIFPQPIKRKGGRGQRNLFSFHEVRAWMVEQLAKRPKPKPKPLNPYPPKGVTPKSFAKCQAGLRRWREEQRRAKMGEGLPSRVYGSRKVRLGY